MSKAITSMDDLIDVRDIIERFEELETDADNFSEVPQEEKEELKILSTLLDELKGILTKATSA